jgi:predicted protein tyrosine phosphatase
MSSRNVLFICSRNQWRSPTAEAVFKKHANVNARSAGTSPNARRTVNAEDLRWADVIVVMEPKHRRQLLAKFRRPLLRKQLHVLHVPDEYHFMDPELVALLRDVVPPLLGIDIDDAG